MDSVAHSFLWRYIFLIGMDELLLEIAAIKEDYIINFAIAIVLLIYTLTTDKIAVLPMSVYCIYGYCTTVSATYAIDHCHRLYLCQFLITEYHHKPLVLQLLVFKFHQLLYRHLNLSISSKCVNLTSCLNC